MKNDTNEDERDGTPPQGVFLNNAVARLHKYYLSGPIKPPEYYVNWFEHIRTIGENDAVMIYINSPGGDASTMIQFLRVFEETRGTIVCCVEGQCVSAATFIFLAAHYQEVSKHASFMFHNYSAIRMGKGGELWDQASFERPWSEELLRSCYKDFFTEQEIDSILSNKDYWMGGKEVMERLERRAAVRVKDAEAKTLKPEPPSIPSFVPEGSRIAIIPVGAEPSKPKPSKRAPKKRK